MIHWEANRILFKAGYSWSRCLGRVCCKRWFLRLTIWREKSKIWQSRKLISEACPPKSQATRGEAVELNFMQVNQFFVAQTDTEGSDRWRQSFNFSPCCWAPSPLWKGNWVAHCVYTTVTLHTMQIHFSGTFGASSSGSSMGLFP